MERVLKIRATAGKSIIVTEPDLDGEILIDINDELIWLSKEQAKELGNYLLEISK